MRYKTMLDLEQVDLYGWQGRVSKFKVDAMIRAIKAGDDILPVNVYKIDNRTYQLTQKLKTDAQGNEIGQIDGGHTRAVAHLLAKKPLEVIVLGELKRLDFGEFQHMHIRELVLDESEKAKEDYAKSKQNNPAYR